MKSAQSLPRTASATKDSTNAINHALPAWKRAIDLTCCFAALPFLVFLTMVMALITRCCAPGPILFRQERMGLNGRRFKIYKFRSMYVNAETTTHQNHFKELVGSRAPMMKLDSKGDARLIPGARLLRASGLDELPQIINVLRGEMSIVGPRPCLPTEADLYQPWQRARFGSVPGLTGLWQVSGKNRTTFDEMILLDIRYGEIKSFFLDLKIISLTIPALLVQIYDTKVGRRSSAVTPYTAVPFAISSDRSSSPVGVDSA